MILSEFGTRLSKDTGIYQLMEDISEALTGHKPLLLLGGGNPARIPRVQEYFTRQMAQLLDEPEKFVRLIGDYSPPNGDLQFIRALVALLNKNYGWQLTPNNVVLTLGGQTAFFLLFNMFAGKFPDGSKRRIMLPLVPEYVGYRDVGLADDFFAVARPEIETLENRFFKYHVNFGNLTVNSNIGAICVSRPTNPTGNVLTDEEIAGLMNLASSNNVPLVIDNAYGAPFPNILFTEANLNWNEQTILTMSLSKLGLPGTRTGIIIARDDIATAIGKINAVMNLALTSFGPALCLELMQSGEIINFCREVICPYYQEKSQRAIKIFQKELDGIDYYIHKSEGAIFLWLWFPELPITSQQLYQRLKLRGVLILPGHHFFPGLSGEWRHQYECIRVSYAMGDEIVSEGIRIIAEEVRNAYERAGAAGGH